MNIERLDAAPTTEEVSREELRQLLESGKFDQVTEEVALRALLAVEVKQLQDQYEAAFELDFLEDMDWEALTMLRLYDKQTFEHSINTYAILKEKIHTIKHQGRTLAEIIVEEGFSLEHLLRAALLHDVGKIKIPAAVINNPITRGEWREIFEEQMIADQKIQLAELLRGKEWEDEETAAKIESLHDENDVYDLPNEEYDEEEKDRLLEKSRQTIAECLDKHMISATQLVPIRMGMSPDNVDALKERGFDPEEPLSSIMRRHEKFSGDIISHVAYERKKTEDSEYSEETLNKIIALATHHHNYERDDKFLGEHPASVTSLHISNRMTSLISMADLKEAMESHARSYRHGEVDIIEIFKEFVNHAERGFIDKHYAALWLKSDLEEMTEEEIGQLIQDRTDKEKEEFKEIRAWIARNAQ